MTTKELIKSEIDVIDDKYLDELYKIIKQFIETKAGSEKAAEPSELMTRLRAHKIQGPKDFSENLDLYLSGEKRAD